jgi:uncharacterized protein (TIGR02145 family)
MPKAGDIPIFMAASHKEMNSTVETTFNEAIGLYITLQSSTIEKTRYIDNTKFYYDSSNDCFQPEEIIFFPEGNNKCDFTSYHPYKNNAINKGESSTKVEVKTNQKEITALTASDFMVAITKGVVASEDPVALDFKHKFSLLNFYLKPFSGYTAEMLLASDPILKIKDTYTRAVYDFNTDKFTGHHTKADIIPHGSWEIKDGILCGKSAIVLPQTLPQSHIFFELYVGDRLFECKMESEYVLNSGIKENDTIILQPLNDAIKTTIITSISEWTAKDTQWTMNETGTVLRTSQLNFTASNVFKVMNKEKQVAEICLEYLCNNEIKEQAVVIYPMADGKTDLTKGLVIELKEETNDKHGGSVSWNATNSLAYTEGTSAVIPFIYITKNGEIKTIRPADALQLQLKPDLLPAGEGSISYPVVKIGSQYWTRSNYKTTRYTDGAEIAYGGKKDSINNNAVVSNNTPKYYSYYISYMYYNAACVATGNLTPDGWRVGNEADYNHLKTYVQNNAAVLKNNSSSNTWKNNNPVTNLTGFNGIGTGYFNKTYTGLTLASAYWCASNEEPNKVNKMAMLQADNNELTISDATIADMALAIRYVRE